MSAGHHEHGHEPQAHDRAFAVGIALNLLYVGVEAGFGWHINSLALLADAAHNLSDVAGLVLAWAGAWAGRLRPNARHSYGWQRASILAAFANTLLLLVAMGSLGWEAIERLQSPQPAQGVTIMVVAGMGIVVNTVTALLFMRGRQQDLNIRAAFLHMAADALVSAGVFIAGALALGFGWSWVDPVASLVVALIVVVGTWDLFRQSLHLMFDGVPDDIDLSDVRRTLAGLPGVTDVLDLHVWAISTKRNALTAHLLKPDGGGDAFLHEAVASIQVAHPIHHVTLQVQSSLPAMGKCDDS